MTEAMTAYAAPRALRSETLSIEDLLSRVRRGQLRMPEFQRPLVWKAEDVRLLLDSVYNGYPIGMLLFWERPAAAGQIRWGHWLQDVPDAARAWGIIDGQHRIASFVLALSRPAAGIWGADPRFTWYWDIRQHTFCQTDRRTPDAPPHWLPLYCVGDMVSLIRWADGLLKANGSEIEVEEARQWARHMADFKLLAYVTEAQDQVEVRRIFDRCNSSGRGLSANDVFHGLYGGDDKSLAVAAAAMTDLQFGTIDRELLMKALLAIDGRNLTNLKASVHDLTPQRAGDLQQPAIGAVRRTVEFLRGDCELPHMELVPYELAVIVLARFFHLFPEPSARSRILLRRWLWRAAVTGSHAKGLRTNVRQSVRAVVPGEEEESVQRLLALVPRTVYVQALWHDQPFRPTSVASKVDVLVLISWQPRSLITGQLLDLSDILVDGVRACTQLHLASGGRAGVHANTAANRLLHPDLTDRSAVKLLAQCGSLVLASHGLDEEDVRALAGPEAAQVIVRRASRLAQDASSFLDSQCEWQRSDRPSIDWIVNSGAEAA